MRKNSKVQDDGDEDVTLPNSPLSNYVRDLNLADGDNLLNNNSSDQADIINEHSQNNLLHEGRELKFGGSSWADRVINFIDCVFSVFFSHVFVLEQYMLKNFVENTVATNLFIDEDKAFVNCWKSEHKTNRRWALLFRMLVIAFMSCFAVFVIQVNISNLKADKSIVEAILFDMYNIVYLYPSVVSLVFLVYIFVELSECFLVYYRLKNLLNCMNTMFLNFKKTIRLIQEAELVARGFTSASVCGLAERIELSSSLPIVTTLRKYPALRKYVFTWLKDIFMEYRFATSTLCDRISQDIEFDFSRNYLAKLDIKEFGIILQYDMSSDSEYEELLKVTDDLSISSLKTMFDLMEHQVSEFFKCFYLASALYADNESKNVGVLQILESIDKRSHLHVLREKMKLLLKKIEKKYMYYRCFEVMNVSDNKINPPTLPEKSGILVAVHNMSLHLKSALLRLIEIEDTLGSKDVTIEIWKDKVLAKKLSSMLHVVRCEIVGYEEYLEKCNTVLDEVLDDGKKPCLCSKVDKVEETRKYDSSSATIERCDLENKIQDEVFEDIISSNIPQREEVGDKVFHQENCQKNSKLLRELKNVLVVKADEHHAREQIALENKRKIQGLFGADHVLDDKDNPMIPEMERFEMVSNEVNSENCDHAKQELCPGEFKERLDFLLKQAPSDTTGVFNVKNDSFAAAIASAAARQRQTLGFSSEQFGDNEDYDVD